MLPASMRLEVVEQRRNVVLPEPEGPMMTTTSCLVDVEATAVENGQAPKRLTTSRPQDRLAGLRHSLGRDRASARPSDQLRVDVPGRPPDIRARSDGRTRPWVSPACVRSSAG